MSETHLTNRVDLLERLTAQQLEVNDRLLQLTRRLEEEQTLYQQQLALQAQLVLQHEERLRQHEERHQQHEERMARLDVLMESIRDLLRRGQNGH